MLRRVMMAAVLLLATGGAAMAGRLEDIQSAGVLRVGINLSGEPIGFRDGDNNPAGYDVEVARQLADALKVKLQIVEVTSAARITMLQGGQLDVVVANMTANVERAKAVDFSIPYLRTGMKLLVRDGAGVKALADLKGKDRRGRPRHHRRGLHQGQCAGRQARLYRRLRATGHPHPPPVPWRRRH